MSEINQGLRAIFKIPFVYSAYQTLVGVTRRQRPILEKYAELADSCAVLDIGCATGEMIENLPGHVRYMGFDKNKDYIAAARQRYGGRGTFVAGDVNHFESLGLPEKSFDRIIIFGVLHHLKDEEAAATLLFARHLVKSDGLVLSVDGVYLEDQSPLARYILSKDRGQHVRTVEGYRALATPCFPDTEVFIERKPLRIPTDYIVMKMRV